MIILELMTGITLLHCYIATLLSSRKQFNNLTIKQCNKGFTLIEFVIVIGILSLTVGSILLILTTTLEGSNQANVTAEIKQNGQATLDSLERQIRNASDVQTAVLPPEASNGIVLTFKEGNDLYIACFNSVASSSNGWIGTASVASGSSAPLFSYYKSLTNRDVIAGVDIGNDPDCKFTVMDDTSGTRKPGVVQIAFTINQGINAPSRQDFQANVKFQTTISLRGY